MVLKNSMKNDYLPKTRQILEQEESLQLEAIQKEFAQDHLPTAFSLLFSYIMDKKEEQSFISSNLNDMWDQLLWYVRGVAEDEDTHPGVKNIAIDILKAESADYYGMLALLRGKMKLAKLDVNTLMGNLNAIADEIERMQQAARSWLERNEGLEWNEHRSELELQPMVLFSSLLEITHEGFTGLLYNFWTIKPEHYGLLQSIDVTKLRFENIDEALYPN